MVVFLVLERLLFRGGVQRKVDYNKDYERTGAGKEYHLFTILILEKLTRPSSVKLGVPSSMKARSVRYMPRYGTHGGLQLHTHTHSANIRQFLRTGFKHLLLYFSLVIDSIYFFSVSLRFLNLPSEDTVFCSLSMSAFV